MNARTVIHRLLGQAFADIATEATASGVGSWSRLATLFETIPPDLERVAAGIGTYDDVLASLRERSQASGLAAWIDGATENELQWRSLGTRTLLLRLAHRALLDLRYEAYEAGNERVYALADLFHNIPLQLESVLQGNETYEGVITWLRQKAERRAGDAAWFARALRETTSAVAP